MNRKEEIILATLKLASERGLGNVSMSQIAEKVGIQKPSLYNHFKSKDEIITAMYQFFREKSKNNLSLENINYSDFIKGKTLEKVLIQSVSNYTKINTDDDLFAFYKVVYSERAVNPIAAKIIIDETNKMIAATKELFVALKAQKKLFTDDIDMTAVSFAMTVHSIMDYRFDFLCSKETIPQDDIMQNYIKWFCGQFGGNKNEKNVD
ncbi:MAG: TetR/AcrR family transcriptional regulator [Oscillospiraceae bacterium]|nr:TetR/AcrR family transcriptional regulator [Oscillospiraceae bacterium]